MFLWLQLWDGNVVLWFPTMMISSLTMLVRIMIMMKVGDHVLEDHGDLALGAGAKKCIWRLRLHFAHPPTSQRTAQPWPESPLSIIVPMHSVHSILRVRLITGDEDSDVDDTGGDNDDDDSFEDSEYIHDIFLFLTRWKVEIVWKMLIFSLNSSKTGRHLTCLFLWIYVHCVCGYHILVEKILPG